MAAPTAALWASWSIGTQEKSFRKNRSTLPSPPPSLKGQIHWQTNVGQLCCNKHSLQVKKDLTVFSFLFAAHAGVCFGGWMGAGRGSNAVFAVKRLWSWRRDPRWESETETEVKGLNVEKQMFAVSPAIHLTSCCFSVTHYRMCVTVVVTFCAEVHVTTTPF